MITCYMHLHFITCLPRKSTSSTTPWTLFCSSLCLGPQTSPGTQEVRRCLLDERMDPHLLVLWLLALELFFCFTNSFFFSGQTTEPHLPSNNKKYCNPVFHLKSISSDLSGGFLLNNSMSFKIFVRASWSVWFLAIGLFHEERHRYSIFSDYLPFLDLPHLCTYADDFSVLVILSKRNCSLILRVEMSFVFSIKWREK